MQALHRATLTGRLKAQIVAVISNDPTAQGLAYAEEAGLETDVVDHSQYESRSAFDAALRQCIDRYRPTLVVLAGFMRVLSDEFVSHFSGKLLNIHPSLLPKYKGLHTHQRVLESGDKEHGVSVHFVEPALDDGPVIAQGILQVQSDDDADQLANRVLDIEHTLYADSIGWVLEGRAQYLPTGLSFDGKPQSSPVVFRDGCYLYPT